VRKPPAELHRFLAAFDPAIGKLFLATRRAVLGAAPDASELVYDAYNAVTIAYTFSDRLAETFCHVAAYSRYVNLGFNRGTDLDDPDGILAGSGARIRHVRIESARDLQRPAVRALLAAAVRQGRGLVSAAPAKPRSRVRPTTGAKRRPRKR
jgi:hypothetical protein